MNGKRLYYIVVLFCLLFSGCGGVCEWLGISTDSSDYIETFKILFWYGGFVGAPLIIGVILICILKIIGEGTSRVTSLGKSILSRGDEIKEVGGSDEVREDDEDADTCV